MSDMNRITLIGRLGKDPEVRTVGSSRVASFSLATSKKWTKDGEKQEKTQWHRVSAWNMGNQKLADLCDAYLRKGMIVCIEGEMEYREWEQDGVKRTSAEVKATNVILLPNKGGAGAADERPSPAPSAEKVAAAVSDSDPDDLPF